MTPSGIDPATFLFVGQCLNQLRHRVPLLYLVPKYNCTYKEYTVKYLIDVECLLRNMFDEFNFGWYRRNITLT
jgi:hypothetical protein